MKKQLDILDGKISTIFLNYLIPSVAGMLGVSLYVLGDTMFVGRGLGTQGLAALNISIPIINIFNGLGLLFGIGGATALSIARGEGREEEVNIIFTKSVLFCISTGLLIAFLGLGYLKELSLFLGAEEGIILDMSMEYLRTLLFASPFFVLNSAMVIFVRSDHGPKLSMIAMLAGTISNIILDYVFIFIFKWGMFGAGFATALSPVISLAIISIHFIKKRNTIKLELAKIELSIIKRILSNGTASFIMETMGGIIIFAFNHRILGIRGNMGVSAYSIIANLSLFCVAIFNGIGQAIQPIVSVNYGARKYERVYEVVRLGIYTSLITGVCFFCIGQFFPKQLSAIFIQGTEKELVDVTIIGIRLYFISFLLMGLNTVITAYLQAIEYAKISTYISIGRGCLFVLVGLMVLPSFFNLNGVWLTLPFAEGITFILSIVLFKECNNIVKYSIKPLAQ